MITGHTTGPLLAPSSATSPSQPNGDHAQLAAKYINALLATLKKQTTILWVLLALVLALATLAFISLGLWLCARRRLKRIAASEARARREHGGWIRPVGGGDAVPLGRRDGIVDSVHRFETEDGKRETWTPEIGGWPALGKPAFVNGRLGWRRI